MEYSECLLTRLNPLAERTCSGTARGVFTCGARCRGLQTYAAATTTSRPALAATSSYSAAANIRTSSGLVPGTLGQVIYRGRAL